MISTTGSNIETYFEWIGEELEKRKYGRVYIEFIVQDGVLVRVIKNSEDSENLAQKVSKK